MAFVARRAAAGTPDRHRCRLHAAERHRDAASRATIETYLQRTKTTLWVEHAFAANAKLKKSPGDYE